MRIRRSLSRWAGTGSRISLIVAALLCLAPTAPGTAGASLTAQERTLTVERFHSDIAVLTSGVIQVRETIRFRFDGAWNGVFRTIPIRYNGPGGFDYKLEVDLVSATLDDGTEPRVESDRQGRSLRWKIWVPDAQDTIRTVTLEYRVPNGLRFFEEHDELYWNVTGHEWDVEVGPATATVQLPQAVTGVRSTSFIGPWGSDAEGGSAQQTGALLEFSSDEPLGWRNGMTVVIGWDPGVVDRPTLLDLIVDFIHANFLILLPLGSWWGMHRLWLARGKDPESRPVTPQYTPPAGIGAAEAGTLIDHSPDIHDITASIVDLAVRGYLVIEEIEPSGIFGRFVGKTEYAFLRQQPPSDDSLRGYERRILDGLFVGGSTRVTTDELENEFYKELSDIRNEVLDGLVEQGFYQQRPDKVMAMWAGIGVVTAGAVGVLTLLFAALIGASPVAAGIGGFGFGLPILVYGIVMPARTVSGARATEHVRGLEEFLARVEKDRFRRMITTPEQFEALLPFAMALKVDDKWAKAFDDLFSEPPDWYRGSYGSEGFRTAHFVSSISNLSSRTGSAMSTAPRSSSCGSSGFSSGGGFSGGGFGGGGGGGF